MQWSAKRSWRFVRVRQGNFRVAKLGATRFDLREPYYIAIASRWSVFLVLALASLVLTVGLFALLYRLEPGALQGPGDYPHAFFFSLQVISTAGFGAMAPGSPYGYVVAGIERVVGVAMIPLVTGILLVRFSRSRSGIVFADKAVIARREGIPTLMIRIGNCKSTLLTGATARVSILLKEIDATGEVWRRYYDLELIRDRLPLFALTWTLIHPIDAASPLYGLGTAELQARWALLVVAIEATDARIAHIVQNIADYDHQAIRFGKRYSPIMAYEADGSTTADLTRISDIVEDAGWAPVSS